MEINKSINKSWLIKEKQGFTRLRREENS